MNDLNKMVIYTVIIMTINVIDLNAQTYNGNFYDEEILLQNPDLVQRPDYYESSSEPIETNEFESYFVDFDSGAPRNVEKSQTSIGFSDIVNQVNIPTENISDETNYFIDF